jgi:hypothetical protein
LETYETLGWDGSQITSAQNRARLTPQAPTLNGDIRTASILSAGDSPARTYQWPVSVRALLETEAASGLSSIASCPSCGLPLRSSRMFPDFYPQMRDVISRSSSADWANSGMYADGLYWTVSTSESRSAAAASTLSQVLQERVSSKYFLSAKAATGILRREEVARPLGASATSFGGWRGDLDHETYIPHLAASLTTDDGNTGRRMEEGQVVAFGGNRTGGPLEVAAALQAHGGPNGRQDFGSETFLLAHTLSADGFDASEDGTGRGTPLVAFSNRGNDTGQIGETLRAGSHGAMPMASTSASVRRLTPVECERLQGFPDGWTDLGNTPDGPRYKAMGNAVSVPVIEYLGRRIMEVLNALSTPVL